MTIQQNDNFMSVSRYRHILVKDVLDTYKTQHLSKEREERINLALTLNAWPSDNSQAEIDAVFLIDKGHKDGKELHCVTKRGIIFILNENKFLNNRNAFITALIARPNQVKRLYMECGMQIPKEIIDKCSRNQEAGFNRM